MTRLACPACGGAVDAACGFHSTARPLTGHQPASQPGPGEHFLSSHRCGDQVTVACHPCGLVARSVTLDAATVAVGGYWR